MKLYTTLAILACAIHSIQAAPINIEGATQITSPQLEASASLGVLLRSLEAGNTPTSAGSNDRAGLLNLGTPRPATSTTTTPRPPTTGSSPYTGLLGALDNLLGGLISNLLGPKKPGSTRLQVGGGVVARDFLKDGVDAL